VHTRVRIVSLDEAGRQRLGDAVPIAERTWMTETMTAATLGKRISLMAVVTATLMSRSGDLLAVAQQAAATEPAIAPAAQAGRKESRRVLGEFWRRIDEDGLLPGVATSSGSPRRPHCWLTPTPSCCCGEPSGRTIPSYQDWLECTWTRLVAGSAAAGR
jgi:hypothetical protein